MGNWVGQLMESLGRGTTAPPNQIPPNLSQHRSLTTTEPPEHLQWNWLFWCYTITSSLTNELIENPIYRLTQSSTATSPVMSAWSGKRFPQSPIIFCDYQAASPGIHHDHHIHQSSRTTQHIVVVTFVVIGPSFETRRTSPEPSSFSTANDLK